MTPSEDQLRKSPSPLNAHAAAQAARHLVDTYADFVWRTLRRSGVSHANAPDAAQQVFLVAIGKLAQIEPGKEKAFLFSTASNVAAHARRTHARRREDPKDFIDAEDRAPSPERALSDHEERELLDEILAQLADELREVLILCEIEEMTMAEVAATLNIPNGTVASRLRRARAAFEELAAQVRSPHRQRHAEAKP